jgi:hypothetical protein
VRAEANSNVKRLAERNLNRRSEWMHRFSFQADVQGRCIAVLLNADALRHDPVDHPSEAELHVLHHGSGVGALGQMNHADSVLSDDDFLGIIL